MTEVLVTLVLSSVVITALFGLLLNTKQRYLEHQSRSRLVQEAQWLYLQLKKSLQNAGYTGCKRHAHIISTAKALEIGEQSVVSRYVNRHAITISQANNRDTIQVNSRPTDRTTRASWMIADCDNAEWINLASLHQTNNRGRLTLATPLTHHYHPHAIIANVETVAWTFRGNTLFFKQGLRADAVLENVEQFQVQYQAGRLTIDIVLSEQVGKKKFTQPFRVVISVRNLS